MLAVVGGGSLLVGVLTAGQTLGGFNRGAALLLPRGRSYGKGPNDFQINRTAFAAGIDPAFAGEQWRLHLFGGPEQVTLDRAALDAMPHHTVELPSLASKGGRLRRPGPVSGFPIWPPRPGTPTRLQPSCPHWNATALQPRDLAKQPDPEPRLAVGVSGQRCRPLVGSRLSGAGYRSRASGCALHQMGVRYRIPGDLMRALRQRASRLYGDRLFHLIVVLAALTLGAYTISVLGVRNLFNPTVWWQSIAVWFAVAVIGHDLILFPLYALADRLLSAPRRSPVGHRDAAATIR